MNHEKHERHENKKQGVAPNVIRAERSEQETDSEVSRFQSTTPLLTKVKSVSAFSIARVL